MKIIIILKKLIIAAAVFGFIYGFIGGFIPGPFAFIPLNSAFFLNCAEAAEENTENLKSAETVPVSVVSTSPAITEILYYIGAGYKLKGVTTLCDYPAEAREIEKIGDLNINYEKLLEIKPDIVFSMKGLRANEADILESFGIKSIALDLNSINDILDSIDRAAVILKAPRNASALRKKFNKFTSMITAKQKNIMRSVYFEIWGEPPMSIGSSSFINEIITNAHGINIFNETAIENIPVSLEKVIESNPEFIIAAYEADTSEIAARPGFSNLIAVKDSNVIKIDYNIYVRPGPRFIDAILDLYNKLFPDSVISAQEISADDQIN